ncbi:MAG: DHA2 family efflux MFS transporter permease subunit [Saprospiraceae bacterium]|nr:DHA2 family efflux MFS transporter permease subunit [Saprospiraceae bacterium]
MINDESWPTRHSSFQHLSFIISKVDFKKLIVVITVISAAIMELIDTSIVNVGLSEMAGNLGVSIEDVAWVVTSYAIANVVIIPMTGFFQRYFGRKNYFMVSIAVFTVASIFCGSAENLETLVAFRFLQGIGGGALLSVSQGILFDSFEIKQRPMASAIFGIGIVLGPTFGPTLGGIIVDNYHWSWMFYINIPFGILALLLSNAFIEKKPDEINIERSKIRVDGIGIALLVGWVAPLQYVLERGVAEDWFDSTTITVLTFVTVICFGLFIWRELATRNPVVDLRVFKNRNLAIGTFLIVVIGFGLFGTVFMYPLFAQRITGYTATMTGMLLIPGAGFTLFIFPMVGKMISKGVPPRLLVFFGYIMFFIFCMMMARLNADAFPMMFITALMVRGVALAMTNIPLINSSVSTLSPQQLPMGIAVTNMFRQIGGAMGIAVINTFIHNRTAQHRTDLVANIVAGQPLTDERISAMTNGMIARGVNAFDAQQLALANLDGIVSKQALMLSYLDSFQLVALFFVLSLPMILLIEKRKVDKETMKAAAEAH